jgi:hypothetical protein
MIMQINAFDKKFLKKGNGILVTHKVRNKTVVSHALIQAVLPLKLTFIFIDGDSVEIKDITPKQVADGLVKLQLMIPFAPTIPGTAANEVAVTLEEEEVEEDVV